MASNVGEVDSHLRLGIGFVCLLLGVLGFAGLLRMVSMPFTRMVDSAIISVIGLLLIGTGYLRRCPLYSVAGYSTA